MVNILPLFYSSFFKEFWRYRGAPFPAARPRNSKKKRRLNRIKPPGTVFVLAEFPKEASLITEDIDERDTIKNLARYCVPYSACSSFAALSGNSDLEHTRRGPTTFQKAEEDSDDEGDMYEGFDDGPSSESDEESNFDSQSETESEESEEDDMEGHRKSIDHLLKVIKVITLRKEREVFLIRHPIGPHCWRNCVP